MIRSAFAVTALLVLSLPARAQDISTPPQRACPCDLVSRVRAKRGTLPKVRAIAEAVERFALAKRLLSTAGTADNTDLALVRENLAFIPTDDLRRLVEQGTQVVVVRGGVSEYAPELAGVQPRGWPEGSTWDDVTGGYFSGDDVVVVAVQGHGEDGGPIVPGNGWTLLHEIGHALDPAKHADGDVGSRSPEFREARDLETDDLAEYFVQDGTDGGYTEAFAESYARRVGGNDDWFDDREALDTYWDTDPLAPAADVSVGRLTSTGPSIARPPVFVFSAPPRGVRFQIYVEDEHGNRQIVGDSEQDRFLHFGRRWLFTTQDSGLAPNRSYTWRIAVLEEGEQVRFTPWRPFRTSAGYSERPDPAPTAGLPLPVDVPGINLGDGPTGGGPSLDGAPADRPEARPPPRRRRGMVGGLR